MELHVWLAFLHILAAIVWVGASITQSVILSRANRNPDRAVVAGLAHELELGRAVSHRPRGTRRDRFRDMDHPHRGLVAFSDTWIWLSLELVGVSMVLGMAYFGPEGRRIGSIVDERGPDDAEFRKRMNRLLVIGQLDLLILVVVLWLMVFKPGLEGG
jgi:uncharacterized membrane protein